MTESDLLAAESGTKEYQEFIEGLGWEVCIRFSILHTAISGFRGFFFRLIWQPTMARQAR
jgi:hypothetical protein